MKITIKPVHIIYKIPTIHATKQWMYFSLGADNSHAVHASAVLWICSQLILVLASLDQDILSEKLLSNVG